MDRFLVEPRRSRRREAFTTLAFRLSDRLFASCASRSCATSLRRRAPGGAAEHLARPPSLRDAGLVESWSCRSVRAPRSTSYEAAGAPALASIRVRRWSGPDLAVADRDQLDRAFERLTADQRAAVVLLLPWPDPARER